MGDGINDDELLKLMSSDAAKFEFAVATFHDIYKVPIEAVVVSFLIYLEMGVCGLLGMAFMLMFVPLLCKS